MAKYVECKPIDHRVVGSNLSMGMCFLFSNILSIWWRNGNSKQYVTIADTKRPIGSYLPFAVNANWNADKSFDGEMQLKC